jgi:predicted metal-dependent phosphoesterase TrpH
LEEAIGRVAAAGGIASLAHPVRISRERAVLQSLVAGLIPHGLEAIECYHPEHTAADTRMCLEIAAEHDLGTTGGSDFHGSYKPDTRLGTGRDGNVHPPFAILEDLRRRFLQKEARQGYSPFEEDHETQNCELKS